MAKKYKRKSEPTFTLSELEQYGFGDWLKKNAGTIGSVVGTGLGALAAPLTGGLSLAAGASLGSSIGGAVGGAVQQNAMQGEANAQQQQMIQQQAAMQNNAMLSNKLQSGQVQNTPTFMCGGKLKKYPTGGSLTPLASNFTTPKGAVIDRGDKPILNEDLMGWGMSGTGQEIMDYGSLNNPKLYSDITGSGDPEALTGRYFTALKTGTGTPANKSNPYMETFLDNTNKALGVDRGFFYNPQGSGLAHVTEATNPALYKQLKERYTATSPNDVAGKRLLSSGSIGVGDKELAVRANGGYLMEYGGASHAGGGIPVDGTTGNPIAVTGAQPNAEVEGNEIAVKFPGSETPFIFSEKLGFAKQAKKIQSKYSKRPNDSISQDAMYMELGGLMNAQEDFKQGLDSHMESIEYGDGGKIHIKPENKGKFTAWASAHGMGVQEAARHVMAHKDKYSSTIVKRANFAKNAAKFKHEDGGELEQYPLGGGLDPYGLGTTVEAATTSPYLWQSTMGTTQPIVATEQISPYRGSIAPLIASGVGNLALMATNRKPDKINPVTVAPEQISLESARTGAKEQATISRANRLRALRESGLSAGQYGALASTSDADINRATNEALRESYLNEQTQNAGYRQQANMYNAQQASQANMANMELQDRYRRQNAQYLQNIAQSVPEYFGQREKYDTLNALSPNYEIVKGKYGRAKFVPKNR